MQEPRSKPRPSPDRIAVETPRLRAEIATRGYVSGIAAGSFLDRKTGARDLGFGLSIVDFLLEPAPEGEAVPEGQYDFGNLVHGDIPKRYVEGPQICTQANELSHTLHRGDDFFAYTTHYRWSQPYPPRDRAGSIWQQTLLFHKDWRFFLSADRVTTVSESPCLYVRVDMPGHIKHKDGMGFEHVFLSYLDPPLISPVEFQRDFPPDARFRYRRGETPPPDRFIRAYQVDLGRREPGPWLAGMTLNPDDVYEAWCHQRGYVCMIEELGGRPTKPGDTFGACYVVGWFDDIAEMERTYDRFRGWSGLALEGPADRPTGFRGLRQDELTPVTA
jgi:hypothetical protein